MVKRTFDVNALKYITLFESLTGAKVKDCIIDDDVLFVIEKGDMGLAIGKQGKSLRRVENTLKKKVKVLEFDDNIEQFAKNYVHPIKDIEVSKHDNKLNIKGKDTKTRAMIIGRDRARINKMQKIMSRYFEIDEINVIQ